MNYDNMCLGSEERPQTIAGGCALCRRCDYWHRADAMLVNACQRPNPLPSDWFDWQKPYLKPGEPFVP